jgi:hypothetical protein
MHLESNIGLSFPVANENQGLMPSLMPGQNVGYCTPLKQLQCRHNRKNQSAKFILRDLVFLYASFIFLPLLFLAT